MNGVARKWIEGGFTTSRLADFASRSKLERQIGHSASFWAGSRTERTVDNALDACEAAGVAPRIRIEVDQDHISVTDNGGGSPTRGAQGNALQTLLAMAHALTGRPGVTVIESLGVRHRISRAQTRR